MAFGSSGASQSSIRRCSASLRRPHFIGNPRSRDLFLLHSRRDIGRSKQGDERMLSSAVRTFSDPDEYAAAILAVNPELTVTERGQFTAKLIQIRSEERRVGK